MRVLRGDRCYLRRKDIGTLASAAGGGSYGFNERIASLPRFISRVSPGVRLWLSRSFPAQRPGGSHCLPNKVLLTGTFPVLLIGLPPFFPALPATTLPLMLQGNSLFSTKSSGEMACPLVAVLRPERERLNPTMLSVLPSTTPRGRRQT